MASAWANAAFYSYSLKSCCFLLCFFGPAASLRSAATLVWCDDWSAAGGCETLAIPRPSSRAAACFGRSGPCGCSKDDSASRDGDGVSLTVVSENSCWIRLSSLISLYRSVLIVCCKTPSRQYKDFKKASSSFRHNDGLCDAGAACGGTGRLGACYIIRDCLAIVRPDDHHIIAGIGDSAMTGSRLRTKMYWWLEPLVGKSVRRVVRVS